MQRKKVFHLLDLTILMNLIFNLKYQSKLGDNFMSDVFRVLYQNIDNESSKSSLILKSVPHIKGFVPILPIWDMFQRENFVYNKVLFKAIFFTSILGIKRKYFSFY